MKWKITIEDVKQGLLLSDFDVAAAHKLMVPLPRINQRVRPSHLSGKAREGCVLLLLYCHQEALHIVLTRRRDDLNSHAGQVSFPGGQREPGEPCREAALRETHEEIGVPPTAVSLLGHLSDVYIPPSDFEVRPFVGWYLPERRPEFHPAEHEVAQILEVPVATLLDDSVRKVGTREWNGMTFPVPYFDVAGHMVWGATAIMLSEFLERLRAVAEKVRG